MKTDHSLPHYNSCPFASILLCYINPFHYYPTIYYWVFEVVSYIQVFRQKPRVHISSPPYVPHALPDSHQYPRSDVMRSRPINYELPITQFPPAACYPFPVGAKYFSSAPCLQTLWVSVFCLHATDQITHDAKGAKLHVLFWYHHSILLF
jgi:hypothetical protein